MTAGLDEAERRLAARDYRGAHELILSAIGADDTNGRAWFLMGVIAADHGNAGRAAELFEKAALLDPQEARGHAFLARAKLGLNDAPGARAAVGRAIALAPADALTMDTIGVVLARLGDHAGALAWFERATAIAPGVAAYWYNLGVSREFLGDFAAAEAALLTSLGLDKDQPRAWWTLTGLRRQTPQDGRTGDLERLFAGAGRDPVAAQQLGHALAKTWEDLGEPLKALDWLGRAKAPRRAETGYRPQADEGLFEAAAAARLAPGPGAASERPVFIVGLPRTGTTLLDRILSSHRQVVSAGELNALGLALKRMSGAPSPLMLDPPTFGAAGGVDPRALGEAYLAATDDLAPPGKTRLIDKMPLNVLYAGLIHQALPQARIICLRRHPLDAVLANYRQLFATEFPYYDYALSLEDTARYYVLFDRLVAHWRARLPADRFTEVAYEDLVADLEGAARRLVGFLGLDWDPACLGFHENAAPVSTASAVQVRSPIYASSVGRWKHYGAALDGARAVLGNLITE